MCLQTKYRGKVFTVTAVQSATHTNKRWSLGTWTGLLAQTDLGGAIVRHLWRVWSCFRWYSLELYHYPRLRLRLKVRRMLKAEVIETLLNGCAPLSPTKGTLIPVQGTADPPRL